MKLVKVVSAKAPVKPAKKVSAKDLFVEPTAYDTVVLACKCASTLGGFGKEKEAADRILNGKYTKDPAGGKALAQDIQLVYDLAIRNLQADKKTALAGLMKT